MGAGLIQLVVFGAEQLYITGQPQITFFKAVYRRHTNFSRESIIQPFTGTPSPGNSTSITIARNGDLLKDVHISFNPRTLFTLIAHYYYDSSGVYYPPYGNFYNSTLYKRTICSDLGHALFEYIDLEIGGNVIDRQYGKWLTIWRDLTEPNHLGLQEDYSPESEIDFNDGNVIGYSGTGATTKYQKMSFTYIGGTIPAYDVLRYTGVLQNNPLLYLAPTQAIVPMKFWFCRNPGLALPLIALQYHEVKLNIKFTSLDKLTIATFEDESVSNKDLIADYSSMNVYADYIYLDTVERRRFSSDNHEYLIEQVQYQRSSGNTINLNFSHPVKEIIATGTKPMQNNFYDNSQRLWVVNSPATPYPLIPSDFPSGNFNGIINSTISMKLLFNGSDRFSARHLSYFTRQQPYAHHTASGLSTLYPDSIAVYSFALRPEEHQPSGTCNFSRINTIQLVLGSLNNTTYDYSNTQIDIYAINYNVLRVSSGMASIAYSN